MNESRHISQPIAAPADDVYRFAADPANLPRWAAGLAHSTVEQVDGQWFADSPMGRVQVRFAGANPFGVLDHVVTLPSGEQVDNPMRVLPDDAGCEVVFTVRRRPGMTADQLEADVRAVTADLAALRAVLEAPA